MKFAYRVGLVVLVNSAISAGGILPGMSTPIVPVIAQTQIDKAQQHYDRGLQLFLKGDAESLQQAIVVFEKALKFSRLEKNILLEASSSNVLGQVYSSIKDNQQALKYYQQAFDIYHSKGDQVAKAKVVVNIASVYVDLGEKQKALGYYNQALPIFLQNNVNGIGTELHTITTLQSIGSIYLDLGEKQKGLDYYQQALSVSQNIGFRFWQMDAFTNLISVCLNLNEDQKALDYSKQALSLLEATRNPTRKGRLLYQIGLSYSKAGYSKQSLEYLAQALTIARSIKDQDGEVAILDSMIFASADSDDYERVIEYGNAILPLLYVNKNPALEAGVLNAIGLNYSFLGKPEKALDSLNRSLVILNALKGEKLKSKVLNNIGLVYAFQGNYEEAIKFYDKALQLRRSSGDREGENATLNNIGSAHGNLKNYPIALKYLNESLSTSRELKAQNGEAMTRLNMGWLYFQQNDWPKVLEYSGQVLPIFRTLGRKRAEAETLRLFAATYQKQGKLNEALSQISTAIEIIESLRSELKNDALKTSYFTSVQSYYQLKTDILMQLHQQQPTQKYDAAALENVDQSRARLLRELLIQANANISKDVSPDLLKQEKTLNQTIDVQEKQLVKLSSQSGRETQLAALKQTIAALYTDRDTLTNTIRRNNPAYANLQYPKPTTLAQIQQQLEPDTLMLQYSLGEKQSYLWVISNTTLKTYLLPKRSDIETTAKLFRQELTGQVDAADRASIEITSVPSKNPNNQPLSSSNALTQQILAPAAADLGQKRLVIVSDGILNTIPFSALNVPNSNTYTPLLTQHEITNLPSASTIAIIRTTVATKPRAPKLLAILADPIFNRNDDRLTGKAIQTNINLDLSEQSARQRNGRDLNLTRLPFTATEAKGILSLVPQENDRTSAFGFDASYDWITSPKISQYRYVHLATHGIFDNSNPALSSIILSSFDAQGRDRKAYLRFPDLFNLNLPAELVVLSACQTGLGNDIPGEGLVGMTHGLMYAGALRVSLSLWNVDDQATSDLMQQFYRNLWQSKMSHAASLRQAQLSLWKQGKAPVYWAAFTLQGEWRN